MVRRCDGDGVDGVLVGHARRRPPPRGFDRCKQKMLRCDLDERHEDRDAFVDNKSLAVSSSGKQMLQ